MGGCRCSFRNCTNTSANSKELHFFHYPVKDIDRCTQWIRNGQNPSYASYSTSQLRNRVVCQVHFEKDYFVNYRCDRLVQGAVPTLFQTDAGIQNVDAVSDTEEDILAECTSTNVQTKNDTIIDFTPADVDNTKFVVLDKGTSGLIFSNLPTEKGNVEVSFKELMAKYNGSSDGSTRPNILSKPFKKRSLEKTKEIKTVNTVNDKVFDAQVNILKRKLTTSVEKQDIVATHGRKSKDKYLGNLFLDVDSLKSSDEDADVLDKSLQTSKKAKESLVVATNPDTTDDEGSVYMIENEPKIVRVYDDDSLEKPPDSKEENEGLDILAPEKTYIKKINENTSDIAEIKQRLINQIKQEKTNQVKVNFMKTSGSKLSKIQLFQGIKKYLSPTVTALLRMELFGSSERQWRSDEKDLALELYTLGDHVYDYMTEELRWRLPPKNQIETWEREIGHGELEELMKDC